MAETMDNNIEYDPPSRHLDANIIGYIETDVDFVVSDDPPTFYIYGVALAWHMLNSDTVEYVVWTCGCKSVDNTQQPWEFWNGHYFSDVHRARDYFAFKANLRPGSITTEILKKMGERS